jgi:dienelactone hydrolase
MTQTYQHLGIFSDWVDAAHRQGALFPDAAPGIETQQRLREVLGFGQRPETPLDVRSENQWERDGVVGEEVSWWVGYGPRTHAYLLKPTNAQGRLPGIIALHDHSAYKFYGKEKIADGPAGQMPGIQALRDIEYGGRAYANALAREGFVVLVPDCFLWGSRKFPLETMTAAVGDRAAKWAEFTDAVRTEFTDASDEIQHYNAVAIDHEHCAEKYCNMLGTSLAGMISHEDRFAVNYLRSLADVQPDRVGCIGLSGGGARAALLNATHDAIAAAVIIGMMTTYEALLDHNIATHSWMLFPSGWARHGDWPDIAACRAHSPLLVQYDLDDDLFTPAGMQAAHERLSTISRSAGSPGAYTGQFYPGLHKFDLEMQKAAFAWLKCCLS